MSEHMTIKGKINFLHLPMEEEGSFSWCQFCKKPLTTMTIYLGQGIVDDYVKAICPNCNKVTWVMSGNIKLDKLDKKCVVCKKKTSAENSVASEFRKRGMAHYCSDNCFNKSMKRRR